jgi:hypothetical protein
MLKFFQQGVSQSGKQLQGAGTPSKPRDVEHQISKTAKQSHSNVQGTITGKPAEMDPMVQKLPTAEPKLSGSDTMKLKRDLTGQSGNRSLMQLGYETSPKLSTVSNKPHIWGITLPQSNLPKNL